MRMIPILYSTPMVQAILLDKKSATRRTKGLEGINKSPEKFMYDGLALPCPVPLRDENHHWFNILDDDGKDTGNYQTVKCPYGQVGDVLWVRETFLNISEFKEAPLFSNVLGDFVYKADTDFIGCNQWKPSIHMPKKAARIFLEIQSITIERLQEITEIGAIAEGIEQVGVNMMDHPLYKIYNNLHPDRDGIIYPKVSFCSLWESINGVDSWELNPWVWVIEFEKTEKPQNII